MARDASWLRASRTRRCRRRRHQPRRVRRSPTPACSTAGAARCTGRISAAFARTLSARQHHHRHLRHRRRPLHVRRRHGGDGHDAADDHRTRRPRARQRGLGAIHPSAHPRHAGLAAHGRAEPPRRRQRQTHCRHRDDGGGQRRAAAGAGDRCRRRALAAAARAPVRQVPAREPEPALPEDAAGSRARHAAADDQAHPRCGGGRRIHVRVALQPLLSRGVRPQAERRARRSVLVQPSTSHGGAPAPRGRAERKRPRP